MKKTLLLTSLITTIFSFAEINGKFKISSDSEITLKKSDYKTKIKEFPLSPKIELEINDSKTGIDFGLEYTAKNLSTKREFLPGFNPNGNIWIKYNIPEFYSTKSYIKATLEDEIKRKNYFPYLNNVVNGKIELNADHKYKDYTFGLNTKTKIKLHDLTFPMFNMKGFNKYRTLTNSKDIESTHILSVKKDKISKLNDFKTEFSINHDFEILKNISLNTEAKYSEIKNLELKGAASITYNHENNALLFKDHKEVEKKAGEYKSIVTQSEFNSDYKSEHDDFNAQIFINDYNILTPKEMNSSFINDGFITYGIKLDNTFKTKKGLSVLTKVSLDALILKDRIAELHKEKIGEKPNPWFPTKKIPIFKDTYINQEKKYSTKGYFETEFGLKYDYKPIDKLTISPEITEKIKISEISYNNVSKKYTSIKTFSITPKISAEYEIIKNLKLDGSANTEFIFSNSTDLNGNFKNSSFQKMNFKGNIGLKYSW